MTTGRIEATKSNMRPRATWFDAPDCTGGHVVHSGDSTPRYTSSAKFWINLDETWRRFAKRTALSAIEGVTNAELDAMCD
jgi:hypothetical protein